MWCEHVQEGSGIVQIRACRQSPQMRAKYSLHQLGCQTSPYVKQTPLLKSSDSYYVEHNYKVYSSVWAIDDNIYGEYISVVQL